MLRDSFTVAAKDLRIEMRSRVLLNQVLPFAVMVLILFAFALGPDRASMTAAAAGLFWVALMFSAVLGVQRSSVLESSEGGRDGLLTSGLDPAGIFLGKTAALCVELLGVEVLLAVGVVLFYGAHVHAAGWLVLACVCGTLGLASVGTLYGTLSTGLKVRETLLPFLLLPAVAPVLLAGTRAWQAGLGTGAVASASPWLSLLAVFAAVYLSLGVAIYGPLLEAA